MYTRVSRVYFIIQQAEMPLCILAINTHINIQYKYNYKLTQQLYTLKREGHT